MKECADRPIAQFKSDDFPQVEATFQATKVSEVIGAVFNMVALTAFKQANEAKGRACRRRADTGALNVSRQTKRSS